MYGGIEGWWFVCILYKITRKKINDGTYIEQIVVQVPQAVTVVALLIEIVSKRSCDGVWWWMTVCVCVSRVDARTFVCAIIRVKYQCKGVYFTHNISLVPGTYIRIRSRP